MIYVLYALLHNGVKSLLNLLCLFACLFMYMGVWSINTFVHQMHAWEVSTGARMSNPCHWIV